MSRYVLDTNVILSALLRTTSIPGRAFAGCASQGTILISAALAEELTDVLGREKFERYITREERETFLDALIDEAELVEITETIRACRDPRDDHILELAVNGHAAFIVTGDQDLLVLNPFRGIPIVSPASILDIFSKA